MAEVDLKEIPNQVMEYFQNLSHDKIFAWIAIVIGVFLVILSFIIQ